MNKQPEHDSNGQSYQLVSSAERIQALLRPIIEKHNLATITIDGHEEEYKSRLLKFGPDDGEIIIEGLHPHSGNRQLSDTGYLNLDTQLDGIDLQFSAKLSKSVEKNGSIYHIVTYPEKIRYWQRRQAFRANVSPAHDISVDLKTNKGMQCKGELFDISIGGICIRFPRKDSLPEEFTKDALACKLSLPDNNDVTCQIKITHFWMNMAGNSLHVGAEFLKLEKNQHRAIERFVTGLQRKQRKNAGS